MPLDLSDSDLSILAMACRSAAHTANGRRMEQRQIGKRAALAVTPEQFVALAERLEAERAAANTRRTQPVDETLADWRAQHGKAQDK